MNPEIAAKIQEIRIKILRGEFTQDDVAEAVEMYRRERGFTMVAIEEKKAKPKKEPKAKKPKAGDALLDQILGESK